jgi:hypothetical protein
MRRPTTRTTSGSRRGEPAKAPTLSSTDIKRLLDEGLKLGAALGDRIAPMKVITHDDLKTRMR